jgi:hypothetical protein
MSPALDFELHYQNLRFQLECLKRTGSAFQSFFEAIMTKADPSFVTIKPWGKLGDEKCDGISHATGTYFQVYAPERMTAAATIAKINDDFSGALANWKALKIWAFVWSAVVAGLPPEVEKRLQSLCTENPTIGIEDWSPDRLWDEVKRLTSQQRAELLGAVPDVAAANRTTAVEVATVLNWLAEQPVQPAQTDEGFEQTALADKLSLNALSDGIASLVGRSLPIVREVERYVNGSVDGDFNRKVASRLVAEYERRSALNNSADAVFVELVDHVVGTPQPTQEQFWAAVGIVSHYFELCDIFKR